VFARMSASLELPLTRALEPQQFHDTALDTARLADCRHSALSRTHTIRMALAEKHPFTPLSNCTPRREAASKLLGLDPKSAD
jgi:hypothetical protein